jgi:hypothetical protein
MRFRTIRRRLLSGTLAELWLQLSKTVSKKTKRKSESMSETTVSAVRRLFRAVFLITRFRNRTCRVWSLFALLANEDGDR